METRPPETWGGGLVLYLVTVHPPRVAKHSLHNYLHFLLSVSSHHHQGPPLLWKRDGRRRGWMPEEDGFLSVPRTFLDTELRDPGKGGPRRAEKLPRWGRAPRRVSLLPRGGGGDDVPHTHTPSSALKNPAFPPPASGSRLVGSPCTSSTHPAAARFLSSVPRPGPEDQRVGVTKGDPAAGGPEGLLLPWHLGPLLALDSSPVSIPQRPLPVSSPLPRPHLP